MKKTRVKKSRDTVCEINTKIHCHRAEVKTIYFADIGDKYRFQYKDRLFAGSVYV
jgi:hypothetical protein